MKRRQLKVLKNTLVDRKPKIGYTKGVCKFIQNGGK